MKISYQWLKNYIALDQPTEKVEEALTLIGFEVEEIIEMGLPPLENVVVGEVLTRDPHPNADRLSVCQVRVDEAGTEKRIVCGAQNYKVGDHVAVALVGAVLPADFIIKRSKIRGESSEGMMCSAKELGLGDDAAGLLILDPKTAVGAPINEVFPDSDVIFDVEVTPNRPDCMSHLGIARELSAYFGLGLAYPEIRHNFDERAPAHPNLFEGVTIEAGENCPHYTAHVIGGAHIGPSPEWLQRALKSIGLRPINNVVDITNYVLFELGQPLHAFDASKIFGRRLIVRQARDGEKIVTLDQKARALSSRMLTIADSERPLAVAGVMGGADAEVDEATTDIVLESAFFRPQSIRWTSKRLGLSSDSSYRFERGVDPGGVVYAAQRAADLIMDIAGGKLLGKMIEAGAASRIKEEIRLKRSYVHARCGFDISDQRIEEILGSLELATSRRFDEEQDVEWTVELPTFRSDIEAPIDLVEEIVRIHGTGNIPEAPVTSVGIVAKDDPVYRYNLRAARYLVGQCFSECMNYSMRAASEIKQWFFQAGEESYALANPLSADQTHMRWSLIPGLLDNVKLNQDRKTGAARFFECGRTFRESGGSIYELNAVAFVIAVDERKRAWLKREPPDFFHAKKHARVLAVLAGFDFDSEEAHPVEAAASAWQEGHSARIGDFMRAFEARMGMINPSCLRAHGIEGDVVAGIIEFRADLFGEPEPLSRFRPFSLFPAAERDLAIVADRGEMAQAVQRKLEAIGTAAAAGRFAVEMVSIFDVYEGKGLPEGKKSLAFALTFRAPDRTLTDEEVNTVFAEIQQRIGAAGYAVRA